MTYADEVLADSPYLWYKLNETGGTTVTDSSGNNRHATIFGTTTPIRSGPSVDGTGTSTDFNGCYLRTDSQISTGFGGASATLECWITPTNLAAGTPRGLFDFSNESRKVRVSDAGLAAGVINFNLDGTQRNTADGLMTNGVRYHVVVTYDHTTGDQRIYLNGVEVHAVTGASAAFTPASGHFRYPFNWSAGREIKGWTQYVALYRTVLSAARIQTHYETGIIYVLSGVTAPITVTANPAGYVGNNFPVEVPGETASTVTVTGYPGLIAKSAGGVTASIAITANPPKPAGDDFTNPIVLTGSSGTGDLDPLGATREPGEPANLFGDSNAETIWLRYIPADPGTFTFDLTTAADYQAGVEIWDGSAFDEPFDIVATNDDTPTASTQAVVGQGTQYNIRIHPDVAGQYQHMTYTWAYTIREPEFAITTGLGAVEQTPGTIRASITNGTPNATVTFTLDGQPGTLWTDELDATGVLTDIAIPLPELPADTYFLRATETISGKTATANFIVLTDPLIRPTDLPADVNATPIPQTGVQRWVIQDPAPGGTSYIFPHNPAEMTTPQPAKNLTIETAIAPDGQPLTFAGADKPRTFEFSGFIFDQAHYDTLVTYAASNRRYFLIDHRERAWTVTFEAFDARAQIKLNLPWAHEYTMRCLIHAGPEHLS